MKKNKKLLIKLLTVLMITLTLIIFVHNKVWADVGDFETYDSDYGSSSSWDSDWSSSSWDDDWGSSWNDGWDSGYGSSYSSSSSGDLALLLMLFGNSPTAVIIFFLVTIWIAYNNNKTRQRRNRNRYNWYREHSVNGIYGHTRNQYQTVSYASIDGTKHTTASLGVQEIEAERNVQAVDEAFNKEEFEAWVKDLFIRLQYAWTDRDWSEIRMFETNELFEQHNRQLERYKMRQQINVLDRVAVNWVKLYKFYQSGGKDVMEVLLNSKMIDYIIDENTKKVVAGDKIANRIRTYKLTFVRKSGVKTQPRKYYC